MSRRNGRQNFESVYNLRQALEAHDRAVRIHNRVVVALQSRLHPRGYFALTKRKIALLIRMNDRTFTALTLSHQHVFADIEKLLFEASRARKNIAMMQVSPRLQRLRAISIG